MPGDIDCLWIRIEGGLTLFGFGNKKKREEFTKFLAEVGNITLTEAEKFHDEHSGFSKQSYSRGLDPQGAVQYLSEKYMEKIHAGHHLGKLPVHDIPDFLLLVGLRISLGWRAAGIPDDTINFNFNYLFQVLEFPMDPQNPDYTYGDRLQELVDEINSQSN